MLVEFGCDLFDPIIEVCNFVFYYRDGFLRLLEVSPVTFNPNFEKENLPRNHEVASLHFLKEFPEASHV